MPRVVIIGGGVAGLAAARHVGNVPGWQVTVLEATSRLGGRVKSIDVNGTQVDIGASWMHETRANPLFTEGLRSGWPMKYTDGIIEHYTESGPLPRKARVIPILHEIESMIAEDFHQEKPLREEGSLKEYVEQALVNMPLVTDEQKSFAALMYRQAEHFVGQPWQNIPAGEGGNANPLGRDAFVLGKGYTTVLEWLEQTTNASGVEYKLNEEALEIIEENDHLIVMTAQDAYTADYIICTIPLGALKHTVGSNGLFKNIDLPPPLIETIEQTDVAALGKIVLRFSQPFWDPDMDIAFLANSKTGHLVTAVNPYKEKDSVLVLLTGPPLTQIVESSPSEAYGHVKWAIEALSGDRSDSSPVPIDCVVSDWTQSRHFLGSYSARSIKQGYDDMVQPYIDGAGRIRFAGEHTTLDGNGCVHGAFMSGIREAKAITSNTISN